MVLACAPLLSDLPFDFNPVDLQNANSPSVVTYRQLQSDPQTSGNDAEVLAPSLEQADAIARRLETVPEVSRALTLSSFVPVDQEQKIATLQAAWRSLGPALDPPGQQPAPDDQENVAAIRGAATGSLEGGGRRRGQRGGDAARRRRSAQSPRGRGPAFGASRGGDRAALDLRPGSTSQKSYPRTVTIQTLPPNLVRDWMLPDGRARVQALSKGDPNDINVLRNFAVAVLGAEPSAAGPRSATMNPGRPSPRPFSRPGRWR